MCRSSNSKLTKKVDIISMTNWQHLKRPITRKLIRWTTFARQMLPALGRLALSKKKKKCEENLQFNRVEKDKLRNNQRHLSMREGIFAFVNTFSLLGRVSVFLTSLSLQELKSSSNWQWWIQCQVECALFTCVSDMRENFSAFFVLVLSQVSSASPLNADPQGASCFTRSFTRTTLLLDTSRKFHEYCVWFMSFDVNGPALESSSSIQKASESVQHVQNCLEFQNQHRKRAEK